MRLIRVTYDIVTPESAEDGDCAERGWIDEDGARMDDPDDDPDESPVDRAVAFIGRGCEPSSMPWSRGTWYTAHDYSTDYSTGAVESRSYHLSGFTEDEERAIYAAVVSR